MLTTLQQLESTAIFFFFFLYIDLLQKLVTALLKYNIMQERMIPLLHHVNEHYDQIQCLYINYW